jgi:nitroreductase/NAD-dependent dihydropyrimidine dehydrogenase PreA subunit
MIIIDEKKCKRDGICVAECPVHIIKMKGDGSVPTPVDGATEQCVKCGHCVAVCPYGALKHNALASAGFSPVNKKFALTVEQAEHFLRARRSIRVYQAKAVEHEKLAKLIDIARYAPTAKNTQLVSWTVVDSLEKVKRLTGMAMEQFRKMAQDKNPIAQKYNLDKVVSGWDKGVDGICRGAPALIIAHSLKEYGLACVDCTSALAYLDLVAPTLGLGTCWAGFFMIAVAMCKPLEQALGLAIGHTVQGAMMAGYPKYKYHLLPPRDEPKVAWI